MVADGVTHIVAICMAPHYSTMSIGAYRARLEEALAGHEADLQVDFVQDWHTQGDYLEGIAHKVTETLQRWPEEQRPSVGVVFTAHSLPEAILKHGDPYPRQLQETASLLARRLDLPADRWMFSYQSAAQTGTPWLGPQIEELIPRLAERGERDLLVAPVGFIADHVEILYDIDIGVQAIARRHGVRVERTPMLNDGPPMIAALSDIVQKALDRSRP
jgi:ferrochelatase